VCGAGHGEDQLAVIDAGDGAGEHGGGANLGVTEHTEEFAETNESFLQEPGDGFDSAVALADTGTPVEHNGFDCWSLNKHIERREDLGRLIFQYGIVGNVVLITNEEIADRLAAGIVGFGPGIANRDDSTVDMGVLFLSTGLMLLSRDHEELSCVDGQTGVWLRYHFQSRRADMASSELSSSSEINQGQGFYHDGKNEAAGMPPLPTPVSPSQIPLEPEEGMWRKYSSHYEFPLSLVIAIGIHVIALLFVVAYMTINFYWGEPKRTIIENVIIVPRINDDNATDDQPKPGGHTGSLGDNSQEQFVPPFDPLVLPKSADTLIPPDRTNELGPVVPAPLRPLESPQLKRPGVPGALGTGLGNGSGNNVGDQQGGTGVKMGRNMRWRIQFNYDEPEVLLAQLANLQVTAAGRLNNGRYLVFQNLVTAASLKNQEMTEEAFTALVKDGKKLWFQSNDRTTCDNFAYAVNFSDRILTLVVVIPNEMEQAILAAELKHHKMTEDEIRAKRLATSFKVLREGSQWNVTVTKSEVLK